MARARILLAQAKAIEALDVLAPLLIDAQTAERWDHVIEMLLQAFHASLFHQSGTGVSLHFPASWDASPQVNGYTRRHNE